MILIGDLENLYRKMLIILCTVLKFWEEIIVYVIPELFGLHFPTFRKQTSTTHSIVTCEGTRVTDTDTSFS